jgi:hypothetical protein
MGSKTTVFCQTDTTVTGILSSPNLNTGTGLFVTGEYVFPTPAEPGYLEVFYVAFNSTDRRNTNSAITPRTPQNFSRRHPVAALPSSPSPAFLAKGSSSISCGIV